MWGAITMKMMRSTSTTSTSGVTLIADCILAGSPSRMGCPRRPEQDVHDLVRRLIDLHLEPLEDPCEVVEGDDRRDCHEDPKGGRDERLGDAAGDRRHSAGPRGGDAAECVDDPDHGPEEADERRRRSDRGQRPGAASHLDQRLDLAVLERGGDERERGGRIGPELLRSVVFDEARRYDLRHVGALMLPGGANRVLDLTRTEGFPELGPKYLRLARGLTEAAVLVQDHSHRKDGEHGEAHHHRESEETDVSQQFRETHDLLLGAPSWRVVSDLIS